MKFAYADPPTLWHRVEDGLPVSPINLVLAYAIHTRLNMHESERYWLAMHGSDHNGNIGWVSEGEIFDSGPEDDRFKVTHWRELDSPSATPAPSASMEPLGFWEYLEANLEEVKKWPGWARGVQEPESRVASIGTAPTWHEIYGACNKAEHDGSHQKRTDCVEWVPYVDPADPEGKP